MTSDRGKRTNSLAFALSDCHTCTSLGEQCDRRRPRCSTCLGQARRCGGFATPLSWDPRRMVNSPTPTAVSDTSAARTDSSKQFRFIRGASRPKKRRKELDNRLNGQDGSPATTPEVSIVETGEHLEKSDENRTDNSLANLEPQEGLFLDDFALFDSLLPSIFATPLPGIEPQDPLVASLMNIPVTATRPGVQTQNENQTMTSVIQSAAAAPNVPGSRIAQGFKFPTSSRLGTDPRISEIASVDHEELIGLYDSEYCVLPLTGDIPGTVNPFRCDRPTSKLSGVLIHAILALCCQHSEHLAGNKSDEAVEHRRKAVQLLESALRTRPVLNLLDPILILFTLDCTLSATGTWSTKLKRAYSMLQNLGGAHVLTTPRMRAQVGMLTWWDATLALISRQSPIIDQSYLDFLIRWEKQDEWSFFDLTGCPRDLLVHLVHLAELAKQAKIASTMKWLTFNMTAVTQIEHELAQWKNDAEAPLNIGSNATEEETMKQIHEQQDRYHCAEAWRLALLLYIETVFKGDGKKRYISVFRLVRKIIDNIRCCRRTSLVQKQLLIPVFLAGSETSDEEMRGFVKDYCSYWGEKSRYNMFNSVPQLLDEIWASGKWWGTVIDSKTRPSSEHEQGDTQLLFG